MKLSYHQQFALSVLLAIFCVTAGRARAQTANAKADKAEQIAQNAVNALGGPAYLNVKTVTGRGLYTPYGADGAGLPSQFVDFIAWPDRERTEFKSSIGRTLQVNDGDTGWTFDGRLKVFKDMAPNQVAEFKSYLRTTLDHLLRGFWRKDGATLSYAGRREAGLGRRNEVVRLVYADGFEIEYEFSATDFMPAKAVYRKLNSEGVLAREEDRYAQFISISGVKAPFIVDHFREDKQASRINYTSIEFNQPLPTDLFTKPANPKAVKWNF